MEDLEESKKSSQHEQVVLFGCRSVCVKEMFSIQQGEITGVSMCLEKAIELLQEHHQQFAAESRVIVFCDSSNALDRLNIGITSLSATADPSSSSSSSSSSNRSRFYHAHTLPPVRSCIYLGHKLEAMGAKVQLLWIPRRSTGPEKIAGDLAGEWKNKSEHYWRYEFDGDWPCSLPSKLRGEILASVEPFSPNGFPWTSTAPAVVQRAAARQERGAPTAPTTTSPTGTSRRPHRG